MSWRQDSELAASAGHPIAASFGAAAEASASSFFFIASMPCCIIRRWAWRARAAGCRRSRRRGSRRLRGKSGSSRCGASGAPSTTDQTRRRAASSTSTISSFAVMPLAKVTMRASPSIFTSVTKSGASRVWIAPTSRTASQTLSRDRRAALISRRIEAMSRLRAAIGFDAGSRPDRPRRPRSSSARSRRAGRACRCPCRRRRARRHGTPRRSCASARRSRNAGRMLSSAGTGLSLAEIHSATASLP